MFLRDVTSTKADAFVTVLLKDEQVAIFNCRSGISYLPGAVEC